MTIVPRETQPPLGSQDLDTVMAWLASLPENDLVLVEEGDGQFRQTLPWPAWQLADWLILSPKVNREIARMLA